MGSVEDEERLGIAGGPPAAPSGEPPASSPRRAPAGRPAPDEEYLAEEHEQEMEQTMARRHAEVMGALRKVFGKLLDIERRVVAVERRREAGSAPSPAVGGRDQGDIDLDAVASDRDLDGPKGDPMIKYDPKKWEGQSYAGYKFSETTPDYLDAMAKYLSACAYMAQKDPDEKKRKGARWKALDAARARGWAQRLRNGWGGAPPATARSRGEAAGGDAQAPAGPPPGQPAEDIML